MNKIWITIVTENQNTIDKANSLALALAEDLGFKEAVKIEKYPKFPNSYKIELETEDLNLDDLNVQCLKITSKIALAWTSYYDDDTNEIELIFNKSAETQFAKNKYHVIRWANAGINKT